MNILNIELENCYGIDKLVHDFDFTYGRNMSIYAPNATMKTSFSKTFFQISKNKSPLDILFGKPTICNIKEDGSDIDKDMIFVIESLNEKYKSDKLTTLLVDSVSMERYNELNKEILQKKKSLIVELNRYSGVVKTSLEDIVMKDFKGVYIYTTFFELLNSINLSNVEDFSKFKYNDLFDSKVEQLLKEDNISSNIEEYYEKYNRLIEESPYFKKDVFNPIKAENIIKSTRSENFFEAEHKVYLNGHNEPIENAEEFEKIINDAKQALLSNAHLKEIENKISQGVKSIKEFQSLIEKYPELIPYLTKEKYPELRRLLWKSYLKQLEHDIKNLLEVYENNKEEMQSIEQQASRQRTIWEDVVEEFERRFYVPYKVFIENKKSMVLGNDTPIIKFKFIDELTGAEKEIDQDILSGMQMLSQGEKRALYLLHIIFEVKARLKKQQKTLFIIDDIVDSFDYKNKYAIIEYLREMADEQLFYQIILTHNFDFFRTIQSRVLGGSSYSNSFMAKKTTSSIELLKAGPNQTNNPFKDWKNKLNTDNNMLISIIPFVRNLAEYLGNSSIENELTKLLHIKTDTKDIDIATLEILIKTILTDIQVSFPNPSKKVFDLIIEQAERIIIPPIVEEVELEKKVVLSIAIRLKAEEYMINTINNPSWTNSITKFQTGKLVKKIKDDSLVNSEKLKVLELVNLITPENIHLNSFMYEPILDMSKAHLISLYNDVKSL